MKVNLYNIEKLDKSLDSTIDLPNELFAIEPNFNAIKSVIDWQLAKRRSGNHKTKNLSEVSGTTAKPFKQKGTGRARQGSSRTVQQRGGATVFGPVVRSHGYKLNKKLRKLGLKSSISFLLNSGRLKIVEDPKLKAINTKSLSKIFNNNEKTIFIKDKDSCENFIKSSRNIKNFNLLDVNGLNVYDLINSKNILITKSSLDNIKKKLS